MKKDCRPYEVNVAGICCHSVIEQYNFCGNCTQSCPFPYDNEIDGLCCSKGQVSVQPWSFADLGLIK